MGELFTIKSLAFDGQLKRSWQCELLEREGSRLNFLGVFDFDITHEHLGRIARGTYSYEYYWLERCYNVFRFHEPDGAFRNYYCNINLPPQLGPSVLEYVDLDIDIIVDGEGRITILDEVEFETNSRIYSYDGSLRSRVSGAVEELLGLINERRFPFDYLKLAQQNG